MFPLDQTRGRTCRIEKESEVQPLPLTGWQKAEKLIMPFVPEDKTPSDMLRILHTLHQ